MGLICSPPQWWLTTPVREVAEMGKDNRGRWMDRMAAAGEGGEMTTTYDRSALRCSSTPWPPAR
jgi:hypothetical protein